MRLGPAKSLAVAVKAVKLKRRGMTWGEVAWKLGVPMKWLRYWTPRAGRAPGCRAGMKASPENISAARQLRAQGLCWKLVERRIGVKWKTLHRALWVEDKRKSLEKITLDSRKSN